MAKTVGEIVIKVLQRFSTHYILILTLLLQSPLSQLAAQSLNNSNSSTQTSESQLSMEEFIEYAQDIIQTKAYIEDGILKAKFIGTSGEKVSPELQFGAAVYGLNELSKKVQNLIAQEDFELADDYSNVHLKFIRMNEEDCLSDTACYLEIRGGQNLRWNAPYKSGSLNFFNTLIPRAYAQSENHQLNEEENNSFMAGFSKGIEIDLLDDGLNAAFSASIGVLVGVFNGLGPIAWTILMSYAAYAIGTDLIQFGKALYNSEYYKAGKILGALMKDVLISVLSGVAGQIAGKNIRRMLTDVANGSDDFAIIARELLKIISQLEWINQRLFRPQPRAPKETPKDTNPNSTGDATHSRVTDNSGSNLGNSHANPKNSSTGPQNSTSTKKAQNTNPDTALLPEPKPKQDLSDFSVAPDGTVIPPGGAGPKTALDANGPQLPLVVPPVLEFEEKSALDAIVLPEPLQKTHFVELAKRFDLKDIGISELTMMSVPERPTLLFAKDFGDNFIIHLPLGGAFEEWQAYEKFRLQGGLAGVNNMGVPRAELWKITYTGATPGTGYTDQDPPRTYEFTLQILPGESADARNMSEEEFNQSFPKRSQNFILAMDYFNERHKERYWSEDILKDGENYYVINNSDANPRVRMRSKKNQTMTQETAFQWIEQEGKWNAIDFMTAPKLTPLDVFGLETADNQFAQIKQRYLEYDDEQALEELKKHLNESEIKAWDSMACTQAIFLGNIPAQCMSYAQKLLKQCKESGEKASNKKLCDILRKLIERDAVYPMNDDNPAKKMEEVGRTQYTVLFNKRRKKMAYYGHKLFSGKATVTEIMNFMSDYITLVLTNETGMKNIRPKNTAKNNKFVLMTYNHKFHEVYYTMYSDLKSKTGKSFFKRSEHMQKVFPLLEKVFNPELYYSKPENKIIKVSGDDLEKLFIRHRSVKPVFEDTEKYQVRQVFTVYANALNNNVEKENPLEEIDHALSNKDINDARDIMYQEILFYKPSLVKDQEDKEESLNTLAELILQDEIDQYYEDLDAKVNEFENEPFYQELSNINSDFDDFIFDVFQHEFIHVDSKPQSNVEDLGEKVDGFEVALKDNDIKTASTILLYRWDRSDLDEEQYRSILRHLKKISSDIQEQENRVVQKSLEQSNVTSSQNINWSQVALKQLDHARYYYAYQEVFSGLSDEQIYIARHFIENNSEEKDKFMHTMRDEDTYLAQQILIRSMDLVETIDSDLAKSIKSSIKKIKRRNKEEDNESVISESSNTENDKIQYTFEFVGGFEKKFQKLPRDVQDAYYKRFVDFIQSNGVDAFISRYDYIVWAVDRSLMPYSKFYKEYRIHWQQKGDKIFVETIGIHKRGH